MHRVQLFSQLPAQLIQRLPMVAQHLGEAPHRGALLGGVQAMH